MNQDWVNDWHAVGVTADVPPGGVVRKRVGSIDLAVFNLGGVFFARADACGDCGQRLSDGQVDGSEVECTGCGRRTSIAEKSDSKPTALIPVMVVDDEIFACMKNQP